MRILKEEILIFITYGIVFLYAIIAHFGRKALPFAIIAIPIALALFVIFVIHMVNILFRGNN